MEPTIVLMKNIENTTLTPELPIDMRFNEGHVVSIVTYSILMIISITGNTTVLYLILQRRRRNRSRINTMLMHLAVADLLVALLMMPMEITWAATVSWPFGDAMCRIMAFFRVFGIYLSSFVLVCISVDRYYAVLKPLQLMDVDRRGKMMLLFAWIGSTLCSAPQMVVFHVEVHPNYTWYEQCITYNAFASDGHELMYSIFGMVMMYFFPLIIIIYTYSSILLEIYRKSRETLGPDRIRRSSLGFLGRAKIRTLKMTIIIVFVFFVCWAPYYIMSVWYWIDRESAKKVDQRIQKGLFLFACTNSCMNPIVYGLFNIRKTTQGSTQNTGTAGKKTSIENVVVFNSRRRDDKNLQKNETIQNQEYNLRRNDVNNDIVNHNLHIYNKRNILKDDISAGNGNMI
ncbi:gonadotropin-releasing hormone II receptor isoform X1 [Aphidius gifuensis]|uniref:gonadotropin-releasing hormone II receptor isoform X1 n=2 Tax=Aphidius gifuensis TaxID=684658 RepID=UPI001CDD256F|nr:gonadotropin-releasing hormone II receptor isoform X1 [Aphidius gifuensis]